MKRCLVLGLAMLMTSSVGCGSARHLRFGSVNSPRLASYCRLPFQKCDQATPCKGESSYSPGADERAPVSPQKFQQEPVPAPPRQVPAPPPPELDLSSHPEKVERKPVLIPIQQSAAELKEKSVQTSQVVWHKMRGY